MSVILGTIVLLALSSKGVNTRSLLKDSVNYVFTLMEIILAVFVTLAVAEFTLGENASAWEITYFRVIFMAIGLYFFIVLRIIERKLLKKILLKSNT